MAEIDDLRAQALAKMQKQSAEPSIEELRAKAMQKLSGAPAPEPAQSGVMDTLKEYTLGPLAKLGKIYNEYGPAPARAGTMAALKGENPVSAWWKQVGEPVEQAPSGADIAAKFGASTKQPEKNLGVPKWLGFSPLAVGAEIASRHSPSEVAGLPIELALDPANALPFVAPVKAALKGTKLAELGAQAVEKVSPYLAKAGSMAERGAYKLGHALTGVPEKEIETYAKQTEAVNKMIKESGGNLTDAATQAREKIQTGLRSKKDALNSEITAELKSAPIEKSVSVEPIKSKLLEIKARLNPNTEADDIAEINELLETVEKEGGAEGKTNLKGINDIKKYLQNKGSASYMKGGQTFTPSGQSQLAAKQGAAEARKILDPLSPKISNANSQLARLHNIEKNINKNLINPDKPEAALIAAGAGTNPRNARMLKRVGEITGQDALGEAERLAAAKRFANPPLLPIDPTGKTSARAGLAYGAGYALGGHTGGMIAAGLTSPAALDVAIRSGRVSSDFIRKIAGGLDQAALNKAYAILKTPQGAELLDRYINQSSPYLKQGESK